MSGTQSKSEDVAFARIRFKRKYALRAANALLFCMALASDSRWHGDARLQAILLALGVLMVGLALAGRLWTSTHHAGRKNRSLLVYGPYSLCRNPMYFCNFLGGIGVAITTGTIALPAAYVGIFALVYPWVIWREEANLLARHGAAFEAYRQRTPSFLPDWSLLRETETFVVNASLVRSKIFDSFPEVVMLAAFTAIHFLHATASLPVWIYSY